MPDEEGSSYPKSLRDANLVLNYFGLPKLEDALAQQLSKSGGSRVHNHPEPIHYDEAIEPKPRSKRKIMRELEREKRKKG